MGKKNRKKKSKKRESSGSGANSSGNDRSNRRSELQAMKYLQESGIAGQAGNWRLCADKYIASIQIAPYNWQYRYNNFSGYCSIVNTERRFSLNEIEKDFKNLKKVRDDENEHKLLRATASFHYGVLRWDMNKRESAARSYRIGLEIINSLTESEKNSIHFFSDPLTMTMRNMATKLIIEQRNIKTDIIKNLSILENPLTHSHTINTNPIFREDGTQIPQEPIRVNYQPTVTTDVNTLTSIIERMKVGGDKCDCCGKQNVKLFPCNRCKMTYYCSKECQKTNWQNGHNKACRKAGQVKVGDYVKLRGLSRRPELNGNIVLVEAKIEDKENRWKVSDEGKGLLLSVSVDNLARIRPEK